MNDGRDYAYGAWTTNGTSPWYSCGTTNPPSVNTSCLAAGTLGITFYMRGSPDTPYKRFVFDGQSGFLFNGVLYGPKDDLEIGGQGAQAAAGQIVGWTIKYHGGTEIIQDWWGIPNDGAPFLIEPVLGE